MKTTETLIPWNLIEKYKNSDIKEKFEIFKIELNFFSEENPDLDLKKGDVILFKNGYDIEMISEILGFDKEGHAYMFWDCYWCAINLSTRLIRKV